MFSRLISIEQYFFEDSEAHFRPRGKTAQNSLRVEICLRPSSCKATLGMRFPHDSGKKRIHLGVRGATEIGYTPGSMEKSDIREYATDAIKFWEPWRLFL
jgi:hypothetical protein